MAVYFLHLCYSSLTSSGVGHFWTEGVRLFSHPIMFNQLCIEGSQMLSSWPKISSSFYSMINLAYLD